MMNEVMRSRQLLREAIRSDIILEELSEHPNPSSIRNCHFILLPEFVGCNNCEVFVLLVADCQ